MALRVLLISLFILNLILFISFVFVRASLWIYCWKLAREDETFVCCRSKGVVIKGIFVRERSVTTIYPRTRWLICSALIRDAKPLFRFPFLSRQMNRWLCLIFFQLRRDICTSQRRDGTRFILQRKLASYIIGRESLQKRNNLEEVATISFVQSSNIEQWTDYCGSVDRQLFSKLMKFYRKNSINSSVKALHCRESDKIVQILSNKAYKAINMMNHCMIKGKICQRTENFRFYDRKKYIFFTPCFRYTFLLYIHLKENFMSSQST